MKPLVIATQIAVRVGAGLLAAGATYLAATRLSRGKQVALLAGAAAAVSG